MYIRACVLACGYACVRVFGQLLIVCAAEYRFACACLLQMHRCAQTTYVQCGVMTTFLKDSNCLLGSVVTLIGSFTPSGLWN